MIAYNNEMPACPPLEKVETALATVSYRRQGEGQPVIFLHGLLGSSAVWSFQFAELSKYYQVISWDAPGYCESSLIDTNIDTWITVLKDFIDALGLKTVSFVGHSMGGTLASRFAACHPERMDKLVLSCTHPGYGEDETSQPSEKLENRLKELNEVGNEAYGCLRARDLLPFDNIPPFVMDYAAEIAATANPEGLRRASRMLQLADNRPYLPLIKAPTLILTGGSDKVVKPSLTADLLSLTPYRQHTVMPGMGHAPYLQSPHYYNNLILSFLQNN